MDHESRNRRSLGPPMDYREGHARGKSEAWSARRGGLAQMIERVYDVFARKHRGDQLAHIGYVDALDDEMARVYAWKTYDEENWFEMCVIRRSNIIPVNRQDGPFSGSKGEGK